VEAEPQTLHYNMMSYSQEERHLSSSVSESVQSEDSDISEIHGDQDNDYESDSDLRGNKSFTRSGGMNKAESEDCAKAFPIPLYPKFMLCGISEKVRIIAV